MYKHLQRALCENKSVAVITIFIYGTLSFIATGFQAMHAYVAWIACSLSIFLGVAVARFVREKYLLCFFPLFLTFAFISMLNYFNNLEEALACTIISLFFPFVYARAGVACYVAGVFAMLLSFSIFGVPLLEGTHRDFMRNLNPLFVSGYALSLISLANEYRRRRYLALPLLLIALLSTYRMLIALPLLLIFFLERKDARLVAALVLLLSLYALSSSDVSSRLSFTFNTFDRVVEMCHFSCGFGSCMNIDHGKAISMLVYGYEASINAGLFGVLFFDAGVLSLLFFFLVGVFLGKMEGKDEALMLSLTLSLLDIGITYFYLYILSLLYTYKILFLNK